MMVGDRLETDIQMGKQSGMMTSVVLTGVSTREDVARMPFPPTFVINNLAELPGLVA
jgi:NagD protein